MKDRFGEIGETGAEIVFDRGNNRTIGDTLGLSNERSDCLRKFRRGSAVKIVGRELSRALHRLAWNQPVVDTGITDVYA